MAEDTKTVDVDSLIKHLEQANESNLISVDVPSSDTTCNFKQLTVKQQSTLITSVITQETDSNAFSYNRSASTIIADNNVDGVEISLADRGPVLVQLRVDTLGPELVIEDTTWDISNREYKYTEQEREKITTTHTCTVSGMSVQYTTPSLKLDVAMNAEAEDRWVEEEAADIISELFKLELAKFITTVTIEEQQLVINLRELNVDDQLRVCDALPVKITKEIMTYIQDIKLLEGQLMMIDTDTFIPTDITLFSV